MSNATIYIRSKNQDTWDEIPNKSDFINSVLTQLRAQQRAKEQAKMREQKNEETNAKTTLQAKDPAVRS
jgi:hypothetical protein